ncbi:hypothetical protein D6C93_02959 [Aureobasidium pullulans]|nr:hypothetical protein D6C93_02959 [Aureobasidium pullulans]
MAPIPPTPDNNPALARYIAKRQAKAGATVPSSLPSNHTNRPSNRTTQIVNPKSRSRAPFKATNLEPGSFSHHSLPTEQSATAYDLPLQTPLRARSCTSFCIPRPYVKANYVKALMRKDRTHTFRLKALPMKLRDMI